MPSVLLPTSLNHPDRYLCRKESRRGEMPVETDLKDVSWEDLKSAGGSSALIRTPGIDPVNHENG